MSQHKYKGVLRQNPTKKLDSDGWEKVTSKKASKDLKKQQNDGSSKGGKSNPCKGCNIAVQSEQALRHHEATCLKLVVDPSKPGFFDQTKKLFSAENIPSKPASAIDFEKVALPPSQPTNENCMTYAAVVTSPAQRNSTPAVSASQENDETPIMDDLDNDGTGNGEVDEEEGDPNCPVCREEVEHGQPGICCNLCNVWYHRPCLDMTEEIYRVRNIIRALVLYEVPIDQGQ